MALIRSGTFGKSGGVSAAIGKQLRIVNLKPVKRITVKFDPFRDDVKNVRDFSGFILSKKVVKTNQLCTLKTDILCDRSESEVHFDLTDGQKFVFKCANLTTLEILQQINKHITPLAPVETVAPETKLDKKSKKKK